MDPLDGPPLARHQPTATRRGSGPRDLPLRPAGAPWRGGRRTGPCDCNGHRRSRRLLAPTRAWRRDSFGRHERDEGIVVPVVPAATVAAPQTAQFPHLPAPAVDPVPLAGLAPPPSEAGGPRLTAAALAEHGPSLREVGGPAAAAAGVALVYHWTVADVQPHRTTTQADLARMPSAQRTGRGWRRCSWLSLRARVVVRTDRAARRCLSPTAPVAPPASPEPSRFPEASPVGAPSPSPC